MKHQGYLELQRKKEAEALVQNELANLRNQVATLQAQNLEKDKVINSQGYTINQVNNQLNSLQNVISNKNTEIGSLQKEITTHKKSINTLEQSLKQRDSIIELISKSVDDLRLEKQELREENKNLKDLLSSNEEKLKEKDFQLSLIQKPISGLDESNIDIDKIFDPFKGNQTIQSEYIEKSESKLVGENSSFLILEENNENI